MIGHIYGLDILTRRIYWHDDGILLGFTPFDGHRVDSVSVGFNWRYNENVKQRELNKILDDTSNHCGTDRFCEVHIDVRFGTLRERLDNKIAALRRAGTFEKPWLAMPWIDPLVGTEDWLKMSSGTSYDKWQAAKTLGLERWNLLPEDVKKATAVYTQRGAQKGKGK